MSADSPLEALVAGVLVDHDSFDDIGYGWHCACGLPFSGDDGWRAHVAAEVVKALGAETRTYWGVREDDGSVWSMPFRPQHGAVSRTVTTVRIASEWTEAER